MRRKLALEQKTLRSAAEARHPPEIAHAEIVPQTHGFVFEIKITARADRCIDQESDVEPKWTTRVTQWILLYASIGTCTF